jgi:putative oxidoreductase
MKTTQNLDFAAAIAPDAATGLHPLGQHVSRLFATRADRAPLLARLALGLVMFPHGAQHVLGWFGGYGFAGTFAWMTGTLGFPAPLAALALVVELLAPMALVLGFAGRLAGLGIFGLMATAATTHAANGFFMNWVGARPAGSEGFEYHLLAMALAAVVILAGSGAWSIDRLVSRRLSPPRAAS